MTVQIKLIFLFFNLVIIKSEYYIKDFYLLPDNSMKSVSWLCGTTKVYISDTDCDWIKMDDNVNMLVKNSCSGQLINIRRIAVSGEEPTFGCATSVSFIPELTINSPPTMKLKSIEIIGLKLKVLFEINIIISFSQRSICGCHTCLEIPNVHYPYHFETILGPSILKRLFPSAGLLINMIDAIKFVNEISDLVDKFSDIRNCLIGLINPNQCGYNIDFGQSCFNLMSSLENDEFFLNDFKVGYYGNTFVHRIGFCLIDNSTINCHGRSLYLDDNGLWLSTIIDFKGNMTNINIHPDIPNPLNPIHNESASGQHGPINNDTIIVTSSGSNPETLFHK